MTYPMPPELLEQVGLDPWEETEWSEDHDALGRGRRRIATAEVGWLDDLPEEDRHDH